MAGCSSSSTSSSSATTTAAGAVLAAAAPGKWAVSKPAGESLGRVLAPPGWTITLWAVGTNNYSAPDSIERDGDHIWVGYQNVTAKDGSDNKTSTIVEYTLDGKVVKTWPVPGHTDGLRIDPATHKVWVTSNEDGNPALNIIDQSTGQVTPYTLAKTVHGGGYDDLAFLNGVTYIACFNPTLDSNGNNVFPAIDTVTLSGTSTTVAPVLMGNATATDVVAKSSTTLNLTDPDSMTIDPQGNLVLVSQGDSAIISIHNPGTPTQAVSKTPIGTQVDDTIWTTSTAGRLFVVDGTTNAIYTLKWSGVSGTIFTEAPNDSGVIGFVGDIDPATGMITPVVTGLGKPTGLMFISDKA